MGVQRKAYKRKQYTNEFKREAVRLVTEGGLSMARAMMSVHVVYRFVASQASDGMWKNWNSPVNVDS